MFFVLRGIGCVLARFGGNWNNGANDGISYWNLNNSSSNANVNNGRQTLIRKLFYFCTLYSPPLGENQAAKSMV